MNFYKHHIGDYDADTAHLSWTEDMAYTRLMRLYYRREMPIPADINQACRLVRAVSKPEREAVESILNEFFKLEADGWHNKRCDKEVDAAKAKAEANRTNGTNGGRPKKSATEREPTNNPVGSHEEPNDNLLQTPDSRQDTQTQKAAEAAQSVFDHWRKIWKHPAARLDEKRRKRIQARLKTFSPEDLRNSIEGFSFSPWHNGTDPKGSGTVYDGIETLLRDDAQVEKGLELYRKRRGSAGASQFMPDGSEVRW